MGHDPIDLDGLNGVDEDFVIDSSPEASQVAEVGLSWASGYLSWVWSLFVAGGVVLSFAAVFLVAPVVAVAKVIVWRWSSCGDERSIRSSSLLTKLCSSLRWV